MKEIIFKGKKYLFIGDSLEENAPIATKRQYENGECSYAHYYPGLGISRFGEKIGDCDDIKFTGKEIETNVTLNSWRGLIESSTWPYNR